MSFRTRNVRQEHKKKMAEKKKKEIFSYISEKAARAYTLAASFFKKYYKWIAGVALIFILLSVASVYISSHASSLAKKTFSITSSLVGQDLKQNNDGITNILLLGSGGEDHEGGYLTDSIIVVSLQNDNKKLSMLSIPRDLYVSYYTQKQKQKGKINEVFRDGMNASKKDSHSVFDQFSQANEDIVQMVSEIIGDDIHYSLYIDFQGFVKIVDALGGITVNVEKAIDDPLYPGPNYTYRPFHLPAGVQNLPGNVALKYVRSRHGNAGGDFGRSARQKQVLFAMKEKAFSVGVLTSPTKIQTMLEIIKENFWTNLSWKELLTLIDIAGNIQKDAVSSYNITDTDGMGTGWFLYTPPRDLYKGASVLVPYTVAEDNPWTQIQLYFQFLSRFPELLTAEKMHVFNASKKEGIAFEVKTHLLRYGMSVAEVGNSTAAYNTCTVEYVSTPETQKLALLLEKKFNFIFVPVEASEERKIGHFYFFLADDYTSKKLIWNPDNKNDIQNEVIPSFSAPATPKLNPSPSKTSINSSFEIR